MPDRQQARENRKSEVRVAPNLSRNRLMHRPVELLGLACHWLAMFIAMAILNQFRYATPTHPLMMTDPYVGNDHRESVFSCSHI
jgi:hypothetical protein